jgi:uncharacterized protein
MTLGAIGIGIASTYFSAASYFWVAQKKLIFGKPKKIRHMNPGPLGECYKIQSVRLNVGNGIFLEGWRSAPSDGEIEGTIIYSGGRNENVAWTPAMCSYTAKQSIWAFNYRGFGNSGGRSSEVSAKGDAKLILEHVTSAEKDLRLATIGRSLGTAMALYMARESGCEKMVLMSPFESIRCVVDKNPVMRSMSWIISEKFDCREDAKAVDAETLVILALDDDKVSNDTSIKLASNIKNVNGILKIPNTEHKTLPRNANTQVVVSRFF